MDSVNDDWGLLSRVSPFRNPRVNGYLLLTAAYRSLSRLSSALSAKASTLRPFLLNLPSYRSWIRSGSSVWYVETYLLNGRMIIDHTMFDVWCLVNYKWLFIISLYEVLKVHWALSKQLAASLVRKYNRSTWRGSFEPSGRVVSLFFYQDIS